MSNPWGKINDENIAKTTRNLRIYKKTYIEPEFRRKPCITTLRVPGGAKVHFPMDKPKEFLENAEKKEIRGKIRVDKAIVENNDCGPWLGFMGKFKQHLPLFAEIVDKKIKLKNKTVDTVYSGWDIFFKYKIGDEIDSSKHFDEHNLDCAEGIHGFFNKTDAEEY